ncbi:MAG TPA: universal stress protein [Afifellaceae bacterium]|nr:universal stress protein [Afifellaceae bacterium]
MIRVILVPVRGDGKGENVLGHAAVLARRFSAHIRVVHCRPRPQDMLPYGIPVPGFMKTQLQEQATELADQVSSSLKAEFDTLVGRFGLRVSDEAIAGEATANWVEEAGRQVEVIKHHGRLADLIAVAQPEKSGMLGVNSLKAALFHTGRPALLCPPAETPPETIGNHIAIAWNGSTEVARAVALNTGLLEDADRITILSGGEEIHGTRAEDLATYLRARGLESSIERFTVKHDAGHKLLELCGSVGADLMLMGAYGDSHEKEIIFGGNTQTVIEEATMPIVLVH